MKKTIVLIGALLLMAGLVTASDETWTKRIVSYQGQDLNLYTKCGSTPQYGSYVSAVLTTTDDKMLDWRMFGCSACNQGTCRPNMDATFLGQPALDQAMAVMARKN